MNFFFRLCVLYFTREITQNQIGLFGCWMPNAVIFVTGLQWCGYTRIHTETFLYVIPLQHRIRTEMRKLKIIIIERMLYSVWVLSRAFLAFLALPLLLYVFTCYFFNEFSLALWKNVDRVFVCVILFFVRGNLIWVWMDTTKRSKKKLFWFFCFSFSVILAWMNFNRKKKCLIGLPTMHTIHTHVHTPCVTHANEFSFCSFLYINVCMFWWKT